MSDIASALAAQVLGEFEDVEVRGAGIEIPNAAGGLREALQIEPQVFRGGDKRYVVLEVDCKKIRHDPITDGKDGPMLAWKRIHVFKAVGATFVDADLVQKHVDEQKDRILRAKEAAAGVVRMEDQDDLESNGDGGEEEGADEA